VLTLARQRGAEILDEPGVDPALRERAMTDLTRSNRWLGGLRAALLAVREAIAQFGPAATILDIGTGLGDIPDHLRRDAERMGATIATIGVDEAVEVLAAARSRGRLTHVVAARALALPFRDGSVDVVTCSQLLHHFENQDAERLLAEMNRVARRAVVVSDLRRSRFAVVGFWAVSLVFRFHRITRHDGMVSVSRGFTDQELSGLIRSATKATPTVSRRVAFRLTARWSPVRLP
jgi:ubiquinone/menaquinone biosynthesis C-methylase UbiE